MIINNKPIILIDGGYYIFYRYFATLRWYKYQGLIMDNMNIEFLECFKKHVNNDLLKLKRKYKSDKENIYFCMDCSRDEIWRKELYSEYKDGRVNNEKFNRKIFDYFNENIKNELNLNLIYSEKLEADDIISIIHNKLNNIKKVIITNDNDFIQLMNESTIIVNMQFKDITVRLEIELKKHLILKCLLGDKSDNIKKIGKLKKSEAINLAKGDEVCLKEWLVLNNELENYEMNLKLIDFNNIPVLLKEKLLKNLNIKNDI